MDPVNIAVAVRRAVRTTIATRISSFLAVHVPSFTHRAMLTVGSSVVLIGMRPAESGADETSMSSVAADLSLTVAVSTLIGGIASHGVDSLPLTLLHMCVVLEVGGVVAPLFLGNLAELFVGNIQYLLAVAISDALLAVATPSVALSGAVCLAAISSLGVGVDSTLAVSLSQASTAIVKAIIMNSIPPVFQFVSLGCILCFIRPIYNMMGIGEPIYNFVLYQVGGAFQSIFERELGLSIASVVSVALSVVSLIPILRIVAQIAAVGCLIDLVLAVLQEVADVDPFPSLLSVLLFSSVLLSMSRLK
jgi:hypothetical protein